MINRVPLPAKAMGFVGLLPLIVAVAGGFSTPLDQFLRDNLSTYSGRLLVTYATIYFCFMTGSLWGFAALSEKQKTLPYLLPFIPLFYMLSAYSVGGGIRLYILIAGFASLIPLDIFFKKSNLTPDWWLRMRMLLNSVAILCLMSFQFKRFIAATFGYDLG
jgi:hypothetical protein